MARIEEFERTIIKYEQIRGLKIVFEKSTSRPDGSPQLGQIAETRQK